MNPKEPSRLESWKEIAAYLQRGERTARRWERLEGLPVHRHQHQQRGSVWSTREEIDEWLRSRQQRTALRQPLRRLWWVALALSVVVVLAILLTRLPSHSIDLGPPTLLTAYLGREIGPSFSPDAKRVVFHWGGDERNPAGLYIKQVPLGDPVLFATGDLVYSPAWSPDGQTIAYVRRKPNGRTSLWRRSVSGGPEYQLAELGGVLFMNNNHLAWSPDGHWILAPAQIDGGPRGIYAIARDGSATRRLTHPPAGTEDNSPALSQSGKGLVFLRISRGVYGPLMKTELGQDMTIASPPVEVHAPGAAFSGVAWNSEQDLVVCGGEPVTERIIWKVSLDPQQKSVPLDVKNCQTLALSRDGRVAVGVGRRAWGLWRVSLEGRSAPVRFAPSTQDDHSPAFSPDGQKVAFISDRSGSAQVWITDVEGRSARQLGPFPGKLKETLSWSPDGKSMAYSASDHDTLERIFVVDDAGKLAHPVTAAGKAALRPSWSRDGKWIYYSSRPGAEPVEIWRVHPDGSGAELVTSQPGGQYARESMDGQTLFFIDGYPLGSLFRRPVGAGPTTKVQDGIRMYGAAVARSGIYLASAEGNGIEHLDPDDGRKRRVVSVPIDNTLMGVTELTVSPDERWLIYPHSDLELDLQLVHIPR